MKKNVQITLNFQYSPPKVFIVSKSLYESTLQFILNLYGEFTPTIEIKEVN